MLTLERQRITRDPFQLDIHVKMLFVWFHVCLFVVFLNVLLDQIMIVSNLAAI